MIRRTTIAILCCLVLAACGEKQGTKLGNNNDQNAQNSEQNNENAENSEDPCAGLEVCMQSGPSCDGNTHIVCQVNSDNCIVKTSEEQCVAPQMCDAALGCFTPGDCDDEAGCEGASDGDTSCDGDELVECSVGNDGCMDAMRTDCTFTSEVCDDSGAVPECVMPPDTCGDGTVDAGEQCDDGNTMDGDGCDSNCMNEIPPNCGDGTVDAGEQCDDGNNTDGDGCSATCMVEIPPNCGDGTVDAGEQCDDGNNTDGDGCSATCMVESRRTAATARWTPASSAMMATTPTATGAARRAWSNPAELRRRHGRRRRAVR